MTDLAQHPRLATRALTRRALLRGMAGFAGLGAMPFLTAACGPGKVTSTGPSPASGASDAPTFDGSGVVTLATYHPVSDVVETITRSTGISVKVNTVFANTFGDGFFTYLSTTPEDIIEAASGYSLRVAAARGLITPIDDIWAKVGSSFAEPFRVAVTGDDGHVYCIPASHYPWAVFYRKSVFADKGYTAPTTWEAFKELAARMQRDGLIPIAMGNKEVFPAMGTFDILNLRLNGYQFHVDLLAGKEIWPDPRVKDVFLHWRELLPFTQPDANGTTWDKATRALATKQAGMYYFGMFLASVVGDVGQAALADLDMFPFPAMGTRFDAEMAIEAPMEGFVLTRNSPTLAEDLDNARALMEFFAQGSTQAAMATASGVIAPSSDASTEGYSALQRRGSELVRSAKRAAQFLDRDTDRGFATKVGPLLQDFLDRPEQDLGAFLERIQAAWSAA